MGQMDQDISVETAQNRSVFGAERGSADWIRVGTACIAALAIIGVFAVLKQSKDIFAPVISALMMGIVLTPLSDVMDRWRVPPAVSALLSVLLALSAILFLLLLIEPYVTQAINRAPIIWYELRGTIDQLKGMLRGLEQMSADVADAIEPSASGEEKEKVSLPSVTDALFLAPQFAAQFMIFTGTLYFFLLTRDGIYRWFDARFDCFGEVQLRHAGEQVARYVLTITGINFGLGCLVAIAMYLLGMPTPVFWGVLAFVLNYVVYLGPIALIATLLVTGIVVFDGPASFMPALVYFMMNATEAQFVTPALVGRTLSVNPLLVFLSLVFWLWLWGPIGGIIALPLLIWGLAVFAAAQAQAISSGTPGRL
ncbi:AI-2E family transporter [uncultured Tateyamaria sp.]|uniref:AI-2E family transporter n=1 Tax=uncultured Tateyamaria sp. TaxID=455651 RepID=UPI00262B8B4F|nr:AI-2E family transporter [uncultured Tateyamaria sp.]